MKVRPDESFQLDHDLRRLRAEIESALRCGELLDRLGVVMLVVGAISPAGADQR